MMLALGMFVFSLSTAAYQELQRQTEWRHASNSRVGAAPARQFVGRGDDTITLPGVILPELAGSALSLDALRLMANTGKAWPMVEGSGRIYGLWIIDGLSETKTLFFRDGTPRRIEFTVNLKRIDDDRIDLLGAGTSAGVNILRALL
ncbi:phage tail protein [Pseudomonas hefeiensis]|jgi:phage protein U|uniref:Phage tail protein n=1 Tax=Pseudomonas hefeiensis TaxID=2738125 RepID=A0ABY9GFQ4_9PSED|nr:MULTISPECIES: phage tail protein [Pseudomonas]UVM63283.1 phage tail protein [Pseudomonas sp. B21-010]WLG24973.1 phage tail protein [Pseudomonas sp. FP1154]WLH14487.1 phage tail protein [Pseudomonas sp. FP205]WLH97547.1 phage tail protein [Pseudomonas sp. FP53]WLI41820.1 phage tail protein [Pseudomonas sp. FP821]